MQLAPPSYRGKPEDFGDEGTPIDGSNFEVLSYRAKRSSEQIGQINTRLDGVTETLGDMRQTLGTVSGQLTALVPLVQQQTAAVLQAGTATITTKLELGAAEAHDVIEERKDTRRAREHSRKFRYDVVLQVVGWLCAGGGFVAILAFAVKEC